MGLLLVVAVWLTASVPLALVTGRKIRKDASPRSAPPSPERTAGLRARLRHIELEEIPKVRLAIEGWVDDPHLATQLRALRAEAEWLRQVLGEADPSPSDPDVPVVA